MNETPNLTLKDINELIGPRLAELRADAKLSQEEISEQLNTYQEAYAITERGVRMIKPIELYNLALKHKVNLNWLFGLSSIKHLSEDPSVYDERNRARAELIKNVKNQGGGKTGGI